MIINLNSNFVRLVPKMLKSIKKEFFIDLIFLTTLFTALISYQLVNQAALDHTVVQTLSTGEILAPSETASWISYRAILQYQRTNLGYSNFIQLLKDQENLVNEFQTFFTLYDSTTSILPDLGFERWVFQWVLKMASSPTISRTSSLILTTTFDEDSNLPKLNQSNNVISSFILLNEDIFNLLINDYINKFLSIPSDALPEAILIGPTFYSSVYSITASTSSLRWVINGSTNSVPDFRLSIDVARTSFISVNALNQEHATVLKEFASKFEINELTQYLFFLDKEDQTKISPEPSNILVLMPFSLINQRLQAETTQLNETMNDALQNLIFSNNMNPLLSLMFNREKVAHYVILHMQLTKWKNFKNDLTDNIKNNGFILLSSDDMIKNYYENAFQIRMTYLLMTLTLFIPFVLIILIGLYYIVNSSSTHLFKEILLRLAANLATRKQLLAVTLIYLSMLLGIAIIGSLLSSIIIVFTINAIFSLNIDLISTFNNTMTNGNENVLATLLALARLDIPEFIIMTMTNYLLTILIVSILHVILFTISIVKQMKMITPTRFGTYKTLMKAEKTILSTNTRSIKSFLRLITRSQPVILVTLLILSTIVTMLLVNAVPLDQRASLTPLLLGPFVIITIPLATLLLRYTIQEIIKFTVKKGEEQGNHKVIALTLFTRYRKSFIRVYLLLIIIIAQLILLQTSLVNVQSITDSKETLEIGSDIILELDQSFFNSINESPLDLPANITPISRTLNLVDSQARVSFIQIVTIESAFINPINLEHDTLSENRKASIILVLIDPTTIFDVLETNPILEDAQEINDILHYFNESSLSEVVKNKTLQAFPCLSPELTLSRIFGSNFDILLDSILIQVNVSMNEPRNGGFNIKNATFYLKFRDSFTEWPSLPSLLQDILGTTAINDQERLIIPIISSQTLISSNPSLIELLNSTSVKLNSYVLVNMQQLTTNSIRSVADALNTLNGIHIIKYRTPRDAPYRLENIFLPIILAQALILILLVLNIHLIILLEFFTQNRTTFGVLIALGIHPKQLRESIKILVATLIATCIIGIVAGLVGLIPFVMLLSFLVTPPSFWKPEISFEAALLSLFLVGGLIISSHLLLKRIEEKDHLLDFSRIADILRES